MKCKRKDCDCINKRKDSEYCTPYCAGLARGTNSTVDKIMKWIEEMECHNIDCSICKLEEKIKGLK